MKPRMLFVSPELPYPLRSGGPLRIYSLLRALSKRFQIHCVTFAQGGAGTQELDSLRPMVAEITVLPLEIHRRNGLPRYLRNLKRAIRFIPPLVDRFAEPPARRRLADLLARGAEWVWLEHLWLAPYVQYIRAGARTVLSAQNVESSVFAELRRFAPHAFEKLGYYVFEKAAKRVEKVYLKRFDRIVAVSEVDRRRLATSCQEEKIFIVPNAVRTKPWSEPQEPPEPVLYFAGRLDYPPNRQGVQWFYRRVWPLVVARLPRIRWTLVGACPERLGFALDRYPRIRLAGEVDSPEPFLNASTLVIVPLHMGGGTRFKILDAWANGKAVVSTDKGAEGLAARPGENIWLANTPEEFAEAVLHLLAQRELRHALGRRGWETVQEHYSWERLEACLEEVFS
jgi:glycosyltransferase involved in cell wall biosynthesis